MKIKKPLSFILKPNLTEFELINNKGALFIKTPDFKQLIKKSEYAQIMANAVVAPAETLPFPENDLYVPRGKKK